MDAELRAAVRMVREQPELLEHFLDAVFEQLSTPSLVVDFRDQVRRRCDSWLQERQKMCKHPRRRVAVVKEQGITSTSGIYDCPDCLMRWLR